MNTPAPDSRLGVWLFGALGGIATTLIAGTRAMARGLCEPQGMTTASELLDGVPLAPLSGLVFGGHEVRDGDLMRSAQEIHERTATIPWQMLQALRGDLRAASRNIRKGCMPNAGRTIQKLVGRAPAKRPLRQQIAAIERDIRAFMRRHKLQRCICVNLVSTEPPLRRLPAHRSLAAFDRALDRDQQSAVRPSTLYAYAAARLGLPFLHFTPGDGALLPAVVELFERNRVPFMGSDGKTGETLVKSALAPMFKYRNLRVLSWQGYNILGDRDGIVLSDHENKQSKLQSKDALLPQILGYPLHSHVGIDYVPSLDDLKTAWDFIHFQGFLGFKMAMQFTWQGCDAILAAPLVLDMIRLLDLAARRGESGPLAHLACFFKQPHSGGTQDLHRQWHLLVDYCQRARAEGGGGKARRGRK